MHGTQTLADAENVTAAGRGNPVEGVVFWLFVAGLAWVPLAQGSSGLQAWGINAMLFPALAVAYELSLLIAGRPHPIALKAIRIPAVMFLAVVGWTFVQMAGATPPAMHGEIWSLAADALGVPLEGRISVNRDLTLQALVRLMTAASVFWLALQFSRDAARANRLMMGLAAICVAYACYGLVVFATASIEPNRNNYVSSTFYNRNNFATYAGIGAVILTGLLLRHYRETIAMADTVRLRLASLIETTGRGGAIYLCGLFIVMAVLLLTGSRGGIVSALCGGIVLLVLSVAQARKRVAGLGGVATFLALGVLIAIGGFGDTLLGKVGQQGFSDASRVAVYRLTLDSIRAAPILGYGYGTFADVFPMFRDRSIDTGGVWLMAHNTYLEVFQGLGLLFGGLLIGSVALLTLRCLRGALKRRQNATLPCIAAGAGCLVAINSLVDFSLQIQAVTLTFMAVLGAGTAQAESSQAIVHD
ncbi:MAG: O-antigen ligase family protein [Pseudolabrys sp.]|nr:O-antigen ligase family protein [Pseudolabrys sp.]